MYSSADAAGAAGQFHSSCDCQIVPEDGQIPAGYDPDEMCRVYEDVHEYGDTDADVAAKLREAHPEMFTDGVWPDLPTGTSADGTLQKANYEQHRRDVITRRFDKSLPDDEFHLIPPEEPAEPPEWWPEDLPPLRAREWNHLLYGYKGKGAHLAGYEWISVGTPFPLSWGPERIAKVIEQVLRTNPVQGSWGVIFDDIAENEHVRVVIKTRKGRQRIGTAHIQSE